MSKTTVYKGHVVSIVSRLCVVYALLLAVLGLVQGLGSNYSGPVHNTLASLDRYALVPEWGGSHIFPLLFALFMLALAYELWYRKKAALIILTFYMVVQGILQLVSGISAHCAILNLLLAAVFLTSWKAFVAWPDPRYLRRLVGVVIIAVPALMIYGTVGLYLGRREYGLSGESVALVKEAWLVVVGRSGIHFVGRDVLFKYTLAIAALAVAAYMLFLLLRSHGYTEGHDPEEESRARAILAAHGGDSLSYFNTRTEKSYYFLRDECFLAYRVIAGMALISADPVGAEGTLAELLSRFKDHCLKMGWRLGGIAQSESTAKALKNLGLRAFVLGEEAIVDLEGFTIEGRSVRKLRQSVNQMARTGVYAEFMFNESMPSHLRYELQKISTTWRGDSPETGYSMGLGRLLSSQDPDCLLALAYDSDARPIGFLYLVPMYPREGYSLDITRTKLGAPRPLSDFLISRTALFLKQEGYSYLSLHFLALSQHYREDREDDGSAFWRAVSKIIDRWFPVVSAYTFDKKFSPQCIKRYLVYPSYLEFLRTGFTVIAAESALKLTRHTERAELEEAAQQLEMD